MAHKYKKGAKLKQQQQKIKQERKVKGEARQEWRMQSQRKRSGRSKTFDSNRISRAR